MGDVFDLAERAIEAYAELIVDTDREPLFGDDETVTRYRSELSRLRAEGQPVACEKRRYAAILERERSKINEAVMLIKRAIGQRGWMSEGRGPYAWDDEGYKREFGEAMADIRAALEPLAKIARDWSDCPTEWIDIQEARRASPMPVPAGWRLVPVEPTEEMLTAGGEVYLTEFGPRDIYRAMLSSSPSAPTGDAHG
jgi:hypothetical protein